jgi:hypothetical protein
MHSIELQHNLWNRYWDTWKSPLTELCKAGSVTRECLKIKMAD